MYEYAIQSFGSLDLDECRRIHQISRDSSNSSSSSGKSSFDDEYYRNRLPSPVIDYSRTVLIHAKPEDNATPENASAVQGLDEAAQNMSGALHTQRSGITEPQRGQVVNISNLEGHTEKSLGEQRIKTDTSILKTNNTIDINPKDIAESSAERNRKVGGQNRKANLHKHIPKVNEKHENARIAKNIESTHKGSHFPAIGPANTAKGVTVRQNDHTGAKSSSVSTSREVTQSNVAVGNVKKWSLSQNPSSQRGQVVNISNLEGHTEKSLGEQRIKTDTSILKTNNTIDINPKDIAESSAERNRKVGGQNRKANLHKHIPKVNEKHKNARIAKNIESTHKGSHFPAIGPANTAKGVTVRQNDHTGAKSSSVSTSREVTQSNVAVGNVKKWSLSQNPSSQSRTAPQNQNKKLMKTGIINSKTHGRRQHDNAKRDVLESSSDTGPCCTANFDETPSLQNPIRRDQFPIPTSRINNRVCGNEQILKSRNDTRYRHAYINSVPVNDGECDIKSVPLPQKWGEDFKDGSHEHLQNQHVPVVINNQPVVESREILNNPASTGESGYRQHENAKRGVLESSSATRPCWTANFDETPSLQNPIRRDPFPIPTISNRQCGKEQILKKSRNDTRYGHAYIIPVPVNDGECDIKSVPLPHRKWDEDFRDESHDRRITPSDEHLQNQHVPVVINNQPVFESREILNNSGVSADESVNFFVDDKPSFLQRIFRCLTCS